VTPTAAYRRGRRLVSPLTRRILAINLLAPVLLVVGLLYTDQYRDALVEAQIDALFAQGELMAGALGEAALTPVDSPPELGAELSRQIIRRLAATSGTRVRLFDPEGQMLADSAVLFEAGRDVQLLPLEPPPSPGMVDRVQGWLEGMVALVRPHRDLPPYRESFGGSAEDYPEVIDALTGEPASELRALPDGAVVVSVAVPVQGLRTVVGALLLSVDSTGLDGRVRDERLTILKLFALVLVVTVLLSLYLGGTIGRPVRRLAAAANMVRSGGNRRVSIPDFGGRRDEIGELARALGDMTDSMYRRLDAIESFAADVAHELKNPLTSIRSAIETLERTQDASRRARLLAIVQDDIARMDRLISDISDASRLDAELSRAELAPIDLSALLTALVGAYRDVHELPDGRLVLQLPENPVRVAGIETRLGQVLRNLLDNALSFSPPGTAITVSLRRDGAQAVLAVEDRGPGIPQDRLESVFDRFYSERPKGEAFGKHSGLGLSISRQIVQAFGGVIAAANVTGPAGEPLGARFTVSLPALP
jgi:two-component system sensor histidine kinase ChvG